MDSIQKVNIDGKLWPSVVSYETENHFKEAIFAGIELGLVDSISPYLDEIKEPQTSMISPKSLRYGNILPVRKTDVLKK